jgi:hypothetical protein
VIGQPVTAFAVTSTPISPGSPVAGPGAIFAPATMRFLETLGFFYGLGVVIIFFAALTLGEVVVARMAARRYAARLADADYRTAPYSADQYPTDRFGPAY